MTRRLTLVLVSTVLATLLIAGFATLIVGNVRARHVTEQELRAQAVDIAANIAATLDSDAVSDAAAPVRRRARLLATLRSLLQLQDLAIITIAPDGTLLGDTLPTGVSPARIHVDELRAAHVVSGNRGNLVYAAAPTQVGSGPLLAVVMTRPANSGLSASLRTFFLAALATLALGVLVALALSRRLTRPIREASAAATRIAGGAFSTRLPEPSVTAHDEVAELTRSVNSMAADLERSRALEQQFLLSISHDLRTPLTSIRGYADAIRDGAAQPGPAAGIILAESRRLERLVADLLDLSKLRAHGFSLNVERVDLSALAAMSIERFQPDAAELSLQLRCAADDTAPVVADHDRLAQVVANLIENALKYASTTVTVAVARHGIWAELWVDDDGPGIASEDLPHVFERLYVARARPRRHENSSGLGLAIVHELIAAMGGEVAASANPGGGARLTVRLPLVERP